MKPWISSEQEFDFFLFGGNGVKHNKKKQKIKNVKSKLTYALTLEITFFDLDSTARIGERVTLL